MNRPAQPPSGGPAGDPGARPNQLQQRVDELRQALSQQDPYQLALRSGARYQALDGARGAFSLPLWEANVRIAYPELTFQHEDTGAPLGVAQQALLAYYLTHADGTPLQGRWLSFADLPDGRFYAQAFQGYTGAELVRRFGADVEGFERAARRVGGFALSVGDRAFSFRLLPLVDLALVYWLGDEDFPSTSQVLFDASAAHHLPTDACAIAGSMLVRRVLGAG